MNSTGHRLCSLFLRYHGHNNVIDSTAICAPRCLKNETCAGPNKCEVSPESTVEVNQQHGATRLKRDGHGNEYGDDSTMGSYNLGIK